MKVADAFSRWLLGLGILLSFISLLRFKIGLKGIRSIFSIVSYSDATDSTFALDGLLRVNQGQHDAKGEKVKSKDSKSQLQNHTGRITVEKKTTDSAVTDSINSPQISTISNRRKTAAVQEVIKNASTRSSCQYDFKVYVYDLPPDIPVVRLGNEARANYTLHVCRKCMLEQFGLEYIVNDFFTQFCGRTYDPSEADYFYLPLLRDAEFRVTVDSTSKTKRQPSPAEEALLDILENSKSDKWKSLFKITDKYWFARGGSDHIIVMPAPVTNFRHETMKRGYFHYMPHLSTPIFLAVEYSLSFVREYPVCSSHKNILMPYPTTDQEFFNGKMFDTPVTRKALLYYAGGTHGDCLGVRRAMKFMMLNSTKLPGVLPPVRTTQHERENGFLAATFCPIPVGDSPSSKRMYDVINFGCIPVVLSDDLVWAFTRQIGGPLDHLSFSIQMPQNVVQFTAITLLQKYGKQKESMGILPDGTLIYNILEESHSNGGSMYDGNAVNCLVQILQKISPKNIELLRAGGVLAAPRFRYYLRNSSMLHNPLNSYTYPDGGAMKVFALQLSKMKAIGLDKIKSQCIAEKAQKHVYLHHFPCEAGMQRRRLDSHTDSQFR